MSDPKRLLRDLRAMDSITRLDRLRDDTPYIDTPPEPAHVREARLQRLATMRANLLAESLRAGDPYEQDFENGMLARIRRDNEPPRCTWAFVAPLVALGFLALWLVMAIRDAMHVYGTSGGAW